MNSLLTILPLLAVAAAETVLHKNHPTGAWELQINSDNDHYYQQPRFLPIPIQPQQAYIQQSDEIPTPLRQHIPIVAQSEINHPNGAFQRSYQSADGQSVSEQGSLKRNFEDDGYVQVRSGHYAYTAPDGTPVALSWVADENGFKATGSHLPQAPAQPC